MPQVEDKLKAHGQGFILPAKNNKEVMTLADIALYQELLQVLSILGATDFLFEVDTSTSPILIVKNVDISSFPKINAWMHKMGSQPGSANSISKFEQEMSLLRERVLK